MSDHYASPSNLDPVMQKPVPEAILGKIRTGYWAAICSGIIHLAMAIFIFKVDGKWNMSEGWLILSGLSFVLAIGIFKKSRAAAILMFSIFLISKLEMYVMGRTMNGLIFSLVFLALFFRAIQGTNEYWRFKSGES